MKAKTLSKILIVGCLTLVLVPVSLLTSGGAPASAERPSPDWKPTKVLNIGNCSTASTGFASGTAMVETISEKTGVQIVVIPNAATADRAQWLKRRVGDMSWLLPTDILFGLNGQYEFKKMGPQSLRVVWVGGQLSHGFPTRANSGIKRFQDLKGRNVPNYIGYSTILNDIKAALAFGNLTYDDVKLVPVSGYAGGIRSVLGGTTDVAMASVSSGLVYELESSIHGLYWIPMPRSDTQGWARFKKINPTYFPVVTTWGAGSTPQKPTESWAFNYLVGAYDDVDPNLTYWFAKQIHENFKDYKDKHVYLHTWTFEEATNVDHWLFPFHEGTVWYLKDIGAWTKEMEAKQREALAKWPQTKTR